jgi:hypothetical protein
VFPEQSRAPPIGGALDCNGRHSCRSILLLLPALYNSLHSILHLLLCRPLLRLLPPLLLLDPMLPPLVCGGAWGNGSSAASICLCCYYCGCWPWLPLACRLLLLPWPATASACGPWCSRSHVSRCGFLCRRQARCCNKDAAKLTKCLCPQPPVCLADLHTFAGMKRNQAAQVKLGSSGWCTDSFRLQIL